MSILIWQVIFKTKFCIDMELLIRIRIFKPSKCDKQTQVHAVHTDAVKIN